MGKEKAIFDNRMHANITRNSNDIRANDTSNECDNILPFATNVLDKLEEKEIKKAIEMFPAIRKIVQEMQNLRIENDNLFNENIELGEKIEELNFYKKDSLSKIRNYDNLKNINSVNKNDNEILKKEIVHVKERAQETIEKNIKLYNSTVTKLEEKLKKQDEIISTKFTFKLASRLREKEKELNQIILKPKISDDKIELIKVLHDRGETQKEIANKVGVSPSTVNKYVKQHRKKLI